MNTGNAKSSSLFSMVIEVLRLFWSSIREAADILSEQALERLLAFLALNPEIGVVVPGSGGIRKMRGQYPERENGAAYG